MLKKELENGIDKAVTEQEYEVINTVYMNYPGLEDKETVYLLFKTFGMPIFHDMHTRAKKIAIVEKHLRALETEKNRLKAGKAEIFSASDFVAIMRDCAEVSKNYS